MYYVHRRMGRAHFQTWEGAIEFALEWHMYTIPHRKAKVYKENGWWVCDPTAWRWS